MAKLCTECLWEGENWIAVPLYAERTSTVPEHINDDTRYKLIIVDKGRLKISSGDKTLDVEAPSIVMLSQKDKIKVKILKPLKLEILYFHPSAVREDFVFERIDKDGFKDRFGQLIYQDYLLIESFTSIKPFTDRVIPLGLYSVARMKNLFSSCESELAGQKDEFWPCRSRSYFMEILFFINYSLLNAFPEEEESREEQERKEFASICEYLNENIEEKITLEMITSRFHINRNKLNDLFMKNTSMTCLSYLEGLRMDLAKIFLVRTALPVSEVSARVGFTDPVYFTKVFKKIYGKTPTEFRRS